MKKLPKYVQKAIDDRLKYQQKANTANGIITEYATKLGLISTTSDPLILQEGALISDIKILCEPEVAKMCTLKVFERAINDLPLLDEDYDTTDNFRIDAFGGIM